MRGTISAGQRGRPGGLALVAVSAGIVLAGCGSAVSGGAGQPAPVSQGKASAAAAAATASAGVPLCADAQKVSRATAQLTVSRTQEILPRDITIAAAPRARALAAALCGLPPMPRGLHCPAALRGALRVEFTAGGHAYPPLRIHDSGCASVSGLGPLRQWTWSSRPGRLLSGAAGSTGRLIPGTHPSSVPTP